MRKSPPPAKLWYHHLTLDLLVRVLSRSIFHPAIVLIFYLCIAAMHKHRQPIAFYTLYWAAILALVDAMVWFNHRLTYGTQRKVNWEEEVVVITGGSSGLGRVLAETLVRRGVMVGVLDIKRPDVEAEELMESGDLAWEVCDVTKLEEVTKSIKHIEQKLGPPSILINNAASPINGKSLLQQESQASVLTSEQAAHTLDVNAVSHFNLLHACLPHLMNSAKSNGAHIVTISSILSRLAPAHLADYAASKAVISTLHQCLNHEIAIHPSPNIEGKVKTVLVETGQMETGLFAEMTNLPWYANFFGPVLDAKDVASEIIRVIGRGDGGVLRMPFYAKIIGAGWYDVLPGSIQRLARWWSGIDHALALGKKSKAL